MKRIFTTQPSKSKEYEDEHGVMLVFDEDEFIPESSSCTCIWGSLWRWSKTNKAKVCKHISNALGEYKNGNKQNLQ